MTKKVAVIAIGGNSLIKDKAHASVQDQYDAANETTAHIAKMIRSGWNVAIAHGNGPQVGFILRRSELAAHELHEVPLGCLWCRFPGCYWLCAAADAAKSSEGHGHG